MTIKPFGLIILIEILTERITPLGHFFDSNERQKKTKSTSSA
jgi:hypothetical protein